MGDTARSQFHKLCEYRFKVEPNFNDLYIYKCRLFTHPIENCMHPMFPLIFGMVVHPKYLCVQRIWAETKTVRLHTCSSWKLKISKI